MYELTVEASFSAAHQLRDYKGRCERLHGHNWRVQVTIASERLNEIGIAMDFHELRRIINDTISGLDHSFLNELFPFTEINPSSENIAKWIYDSIKKKIEKDHKGINLTSVTVFESDTASATYYE